MSVKIHRIANTSIPPIMHTAEILSVIDAYIYDEAEDNQINIPQILKEVDRVISLGELGKEILLLSPDKVFYGLGKDAWKDIIDGKHHARGHLAFDTSRPEHPGEPGFYSSMMSACEKASRFIFAPSRIRNVTLYRIIHRSACQHFTGKSKEDHTLISSSYTGEFMAIPFKSCSGGYEDLFIGNPTTFTSVATMTQRWLTLESLISSFAGSSISEVIDMCARNAMTWDYNSLSLDQQIAVRQRYLTEKEVFDERALNTITRKVLFARVQTLHREAEKRWKTEIDPIVRAKIKEVNSEIQERSSALGVMETGGKLVNLAHILNDGLGVRVVYTCPGGGLLEEVVIRIFNRFEQNISTATSKAERRRCIADLYQMLEWAHPFPDGQGRTDLIMLKALLVTYGLTPAILDEPYMSTFCSLNQWDAYLARGMEKWKVEFASKKVTSA